MSSCPAPPVLSDEDKVSKAAAIAKAMGVQSCNADNTAVTAHGKIASLLGTAEMEVTFLYLNRRPQSVGSPSKGT